MYGAGDDLRDSPAATDAAQELGVVSGHGWRRRHQIAAHCVRQLQFRVGSHLGAARRYRSVRLGRLQPAGDELAQFVILQVEDVIRRLEVASSNKAFGKC